MPGTTFHSLEELPAERHVVTIGSFDGVHRGHQRLLHRVTETASNLSLPSLVVTFEPLPAEVLRPDLAPPRVCTTEERIRLMTHYGIDRTAKLRFDNALSNQSAAEFLENLCRRARPAALIVGEDFAFGHKRQGNHEFLRGEAHRLGYSLHVEPRYNPIDGPEWSSSAVRRALLESGDVIAAAEILGRRFRIAGRVVNGDHRGRTLGYPTANLSLPDRQLTPADGIYAAIASLSGNPDLLETPCLVYIGSRPTFGQSQRTVEAYLLDFDGDLYDCELNLDFVDRIRGDRAFDSAAELVEQMRRDEADGRVIFQRHGLHVSSTSS
jgi:riboflavin kinase / FMN adenylyltransferase